MIRILHLYPELMNLYGDYGNLSIIVNRIKKMGLKVKVERKEYQDPIFFADYDFVYMGSGTEKNEMCALKDLIKYELYIKEYAKNVDNTGIIVCDADGNPIPTEANDVIEKGSNIYEC